MIDPVVNNPIPERGSFSHIDSRDLQTRTTARAAECLYGIRPSRRLLEWIANREGGHLYSMTARRLLLRHHGVHVGAYSYGPCMIADALPAGVTVGRYVSMAAEFRVFLRNHPTNRLSTHPFFFNAHLGKVGRDTIGTGSLSIGHDAWIGYGAITTPGCRRIGVGAVVGAFTVVTRDVPDFAIVAGNPMKVLRFRFNEDVRETILRSRWWERSAADLCAHLDDLTAELGDNVLSNSKLFRYERNSIA